MADGDEHRASPARGRRREGHPDRGADDPLHRCLPPRARRSCSTSWSTRSTTRSTVWTTSSCGSTPAGATRTCRRSTPASRTRTRSSIYLNRLKGDVWTVEATENDLAEIDLFKPYAGQPRKKKVAVGVVNHRTLQADMAPVVAGRIRRALEVIPADKLILSTDCGFGRQGFNRIVAFYKATGHRAGRGTSSSRSSGSRSATCAAADPSLQTDVLPGPRAALTRTCQHHPGSSGAGAGGQRRSGFLTGSRRGELGPMGSALRLGRPADAIRDHHPGLRRGRVDEPQTGHRPRHPGPGRCPEPRTSGWIERDGDSSIRVRSSAIGAWASFAAAEDREGPCHRPFLGNAATSAASPASELPSSSTAGAHGASSGPRCFQELASRTSVRDGSSVWPGPEAVEVLVCPSTQGSCRRCCPRALLGGLARWLDLRTAPPSPVALEPAAAILIRPRRAPAAAHIKVRFSEGDDAGHPAAPFYHSSIALGRAGSGYRATR